MPIVSVIIPTYNRAEYLKLAIESIFSQDFQDFEIIITDNASTDHTKKVVEEFQSKKIIYYRNEKNIGVVPNHNLALRYASGKYIHIFSDDDIMLPGNLSKKVRILEQNLNVGFVHSNINIINENNTIIERGHWGKRYISNWDKLHSRDSLFPGLKYFAILINQWNLIAMPTVLIRRDLIEQNGYFDLNTHMYCDWEIWMRNSIFSDVYYLSDILVSYRRHSSNTIKQIQNDSSISELSYIKNKLRSIFLTIHPELNVADYILEVDIESQIIKRPLTQKTLFQKIKRKMKRILL